MCRNIFHFERSDRGMGKGNGSDEVLVVCSDRNMGTGIAIWDMETGDRVVHIPTCASPLHGLLCLRDQFLVASQVNKHGSVGGGAIFTWALNKPQQPLRSYPLEAIGPLGCTKDGLFLAGGSPSGNVYLWEVADGRLLKTWRAHSKSLKCLSFSKDGSLLISGSEDGVVCVWSMVSLLDTENFESSCSLLHYSSEHTSSVTGLLTTSGIANSTFISSSLDATCKAWDVVSGRLIQTQDYPLGITAIVTDLAEQLLFAGGVDGSIFVSVLDIGLLEDPCAVAGDEPVVLKGHNGSITALTFSSVGLISASEDCTVCLWDVISKVIIRRFSHHKGAVTNLVVIPRSASNHRRVSNQFRVSVLNKCPQPANSSNGILTLLHTCSSPVDFIRTNSLDQQIFEMEQEQTPAAMQMKVETSMDHRTWARRMTNHVMEMNRDLQSRLLDSIQIRLLLASGNDSRATGKSKKLKIESPPPLQQEKSCPGNEQIANAVNRRMLVPEDIIFGLLSKRLEDGYYKGETGFILDGIPRSRLQAEILDQLVEIDLVVNFRCTDDYLMKHQQEGVWKERVYAEQSKPLEDYYQKQKRLLDFQVGSAPAENWQGLLAALHLQHINALCSSKKPTAPSSML